MKGNNVIVGFYDEIVWYYNMIRGIVLGYLDMVLGQWGIVLGWQVFLWDRGFL